jgi:hypothetical protein
MVATWSSQVSTSAALAGVANVTKPRKRLKAKDLGNSDFMDEFHWPAPILATGKGLFLVNFL